LNLRMWQGAQREQSLEACDYAGYNVTRVGTDVANRGLILWLGASARSLLWLPTTC
jgi:hypothetical protein